MDKSLRIDCICNDGSPIGVVLADVYGDNGRLGVGGAELALLTLCEAWHKAGHRVRVYNSPTNLSSPFGQYPKDSFIPSEDRDILIVFRSPNHRIKGAKGKKIWWSTDQYTVGDFAKFSKQVDSIVTISQFHAEHFKNTYGIEGTTTIDLPVRLEDYAVEVPKVPGKMIFCSVPDRGLQVLAKAYPYIKENVRDCSLSITSDYRLWGVPEARNEQYIQKFFGMDGVRFLGAVPRREMVHEQLSAQVQAYPSTYDELFCYAVAECQVAGAIPVTTSKGAISTTNMGVQVAGDANDPHWIKSYGDKVIETLLSPSLPERQAGIRKIATERFSLDRILGQWDEVFNG